jgi:hypothetical protein
MSGQFLKWIIELDSQLCNYAEVSGAFW